MPCMARVLLAAKSAGACTRYTQCLTCCWLQRPLGTLQLHAGLRLLFRYWTCNCMLPCTLHFFGVPAPWRVRVHPTHHAQPRPHRTWPFFGSTPPNLAVRVQLQHHTTTHQSILFRPGCPTFTIELHTDLVSLCVQDTAVLEGARPN